MIFFFFSSRRRHTRYIVTGVLTLLFRSPRFWRWPRLERPDPTPHRGIPGTRPGGGPAPSRDRKSVAEGKSILPVGRALNKNHDKNSYPRNKDIKKKS